MYPVFDPDDPTTQVNALRVLFLRLTDDEDSAPPDATSFEFGIP